MKSASQGFTLIEVLVALVILSVALAAVFYTNAQNTRALQRIKQHILANMVASDAAVAVMLNQVSPTMLKGTVTTTIAHRSFGWNAQFRTDNTSGYEQLTIDVYRDQQPVIQRKFGIIQLIQSSP